MTLDSRPLMPLLSGSLESLRVLQNSESNGKMEEEEEKCPSIHLSILKRCTLKRPQFSMLNTSLSGCSKCTFADAAAVAVFAFTRLLSTLSFLMIVFLHYVLVLHSHLNVNVFSLFFSMIANKFLPGLKHSSFSILYFFAHVHRSSKPLEGI